MLQLKYDNGSSRIATIKSSSLSETWKLIPGMGLLAENFYFGNFRQLLNDIAKNELILIYDGAFVERVRNKFTEKIHWDLNPIPSEY